MAEYCMVSENILYKLENVFTVMKDTESECTSSPRLLSNNNSHNCVYKNINATELHAVFWSLVSRTLNVLFLILSVPI